MCQTVFLSTWYIILILGRLTRFVPKQQVAFLLGKHVEVSGISSKRWQTKRGQPWNNYFHLYTLHDLILFPFKYVHFSHESCKLDNGCQWNLTESVWIRVTRYGNPILKPSFTARSGKVMRVVWPLWLLSDHHLVFHHLHRKSDEPFRCKKVFGLQHHLCLNPPKTGHPAMVRMVRCPMVEWESVSLECLLMILT